MLVVAGVGGVGGGVTGAEVGGGLGDGIGGGVGREVGGGSGVGDFVLLGGRPTNQRWAEYLLQGWRYHGLLGWGKKLKTCVCCLDWRQIICQHRPRLHTQPTDKATHQGPKLLKISAGLQLSHFRALQL